jgi:hypothetical protein
MKKVLKALGIGLLVLIAIPVVLYVFFVLYNLRDDDLDPEAAKLLAATPAQISAAENGYFAWMGVGGPETQPPHAWGKRWFEEVLAADKKPPGVDQQITLAIDSERRKDDLNAKLVPCDKPEVCLEEVAARPDFARTALARGRVTLERCNAAIAFPAYQEAWRPDFSLASTFSSYPYLWRQLSATRFALAVAEERHDEALEQLGRGMAFHTRQMQGAVTLIEKLVALAYLRNDYLLLNQYLLRQPSAARQRVERIAVLLAPLPQDAASLQTVMETEWRLSARFLFNLKEQIGSAFSQRTLDGDQVPSLGGRAGDELGAPLYLPKASANELYRARKAVLIRDSLPDEAYRQSIAASRRHDEDMESSGIRLALRNPVGHILVQVGAPNFDSYFLKRDDLLVLRAAAAFQLDLMRQGVTDADAIAQTIPAAGLTHPFTGAAPTWDGAARTLTYSALRERRNDALVIKL